MVAQTERWRIEPGTRVALDQIDTRSTEGAPGRKELTRSASGALVAALSGFQNRLWAEHDQSLLLVLQAMDAGGKDGTTRKVFTGVNPQGVEVTSFKVPSEEELAHDFLWRIHKRVPKAGHIGVFNRSHYEDVLVARVEELVPEKVWRRRYRAIRDFEAMLTDGGTRIVKIFLHISREEQAERFRDRLDDPDKRWKLSRADLEVREHWNDYREAYEEAISETSTVDCPWFVVPADRKWYRDWSVLQILVGALEGMNPRFPEPNDGLDGLVIV